MSNRVILSAVALMMMGSTAIARPSIAVNIDGTIGAGEWTGAATYTIGNGGGTVYLRADQNFVYAAFDILGWTSAMGAASGGNLLGFGVWDANNSAGVTGNGVEFQQATAAANWGGGGNSGTMNGLVSAFRVDGGSPEASIPGSLEAKDSFASGHRVWEVKMPISTMGVNPGDTIWAVGGINYASAQHWYPDYFFPGYSGYAPVIVEGHVIPLPTPIVMASAGLLAIAGVSRRRVAR